MADLSPRWSAPAVFSDASRMKFHNCKMRHGVKALQQFQSWAPNYLAESGCPLQASQAPQHVWSAHMHITLQLSRTRAKQQALANRHDTTSHRR
jgi:hypothetical protein